MKLARRGARVLLTDTFRVKKAVHIANGKRSVTRAVVKQTKKVEVPAEASKPAAAARAAAAQTQEFAAAAPGEAASDATADVAAEAAKPPQRRKRAAKPAASAASAAGAAVAALTVVVATPAPPLPPLDSDRIAAGVVHLASVNDREYYHPVFSATVGSAQRTRVPCMPDRVTQRASCAIRWPLHITSTIRLSRSGGAHCGARAARAAGAFQRQHVFGVDAQHSVAAARRRGSPHHLRPLPPRLQGEIPGRRSSWQSPCIAIARQARNSHHFLDINPGLITLP